MAVIRALIETGADDTLVNLEDYVKKTELEALVDAQLDLLEPLIETFLFPVIAGQFTVSIASIPLPYTVSEVYFNGVFQGPATYTLSGTDITFSEALPNDGRVDVVVAKVQPLGVSDLLYTAPFTGAQTRTSTSKWSDVVSVKDFGAVGDGVADDTAAIQAAVNYAIARSAHAALLGFSTDILFPSGEYLVTSTITVPGGRVGFVGEGQEGTKITGSVTLFDVGDHTPGAPRARGVTFRSLNLVCSDLAGAASSVILYRTISALFEDVNFVSWNVGLDCFRASTTRMDRCTINGQFRTVGGLAGIRLQGTDETQTGEVYTPGGGTHIADCEIFGEVPGGGQPLASGILVHAVDGLYISQSHVAGCTAGLNLDPQGSAANHAIIDVRCVDCYWDDPNGASNVYNVRIGGTVRESIAMADASTQQSIYQDISFSGGKFRGAGIATNNVKFEVADGDSWFDSTTRLSGIAFNGNTFIESIGPNVTIAANTIEPTGIVFTGNYFTKGNSGASASVGAAINLSAESGCIVGNVFGPAAGASDYIASLTLSDSGAADNPNPSFVVVGNDLSKAVATVEPVRVNQASSQGADTLQADNLYPGQGRTLKQVYKLTTTDATTTNAFAYAIQPSQAGAVTATVSGCNADGTKAVVYQFYTGFRNNGVASSLSSGVATWTLVRQWNPDAIATVPSADLSGNTLRVRVTGVAAETWTWSVDIDMTGAK